MARKRGNGEGSITKRPDNRWCSVITTGYDPNTGKQKRKSFYGKTRQEVAEKMSRALNQIGAGITIDETKITVSEWLTIWLNEYAKPNIRPSTWKSYEMLSRLYIIPNIGLVKLKKLQPNQLQTLYNNLSTNGRIKIKGGLSPRTVTLVNVVMHQSLEQAVKEGLLIRNVTAATRLPKREKKEMRVLSPEEQKQLLAVLQGDRLGCAIWVLLGSGLRCGELLALRWQDTDIQEGTIRVSRSLSRVYSNEGSKKTQLVFHALKTAKSQRSVPLPASVTNELRKHRLRQNEEKLLAGAGYNNQDLAFCTELGQPIDPRNLTRKLDQFTKMAGIERINLHGLRHTYATRLLELGENPKVVQELLGHSQISLTLDTYSHVFPEIKQEAAKRLDTIFTDKKNPPAKEGLL